MTVPVFDKMLVDLTDGVATLTFNDPALGNALTPALCLDYLSAIEWASECDAVKVVVQTGAGKFFTTGKYLSPTHADNRALERDMFSTTFPRLIEALIDCKKILIALINGPGVGYGLTCLALHDLVYSVPDAYFFAPFMKWGYCAEACSSITFPKILGRQRASALLLGGERISALDLMAAGLINNIFTRDALLTEVSQITRRIAHYPQTAVEATKGLMRHVDRDELIAANARECIELRKRIDDPESIALLTAHFDRKEGKKSGRL